MRKGEKVGVRDLEGQTFIVGREGHIYIDGPAISRQHAEIKFIDGRIRLRDLGSTNGLFLLRNRKLIPFQEGYVQPQQPVVIGNQKYTVKQWLEALGIFAEMMTGSPSRSQNRTNPSRTNQGSG
jgi:pSer/pThr/pTyr-binding forkhead associated (FHA) protein